MTFFEENYFNCINSISSYNFFCKVDKFLYFRDLSSKDQTFFIFRFFYVQKIIFKQKQ